MGEQCLSISHISVAAYVICVFVVLGVISKQWIVKKEQAGAGRDCPVARLVSIWDIPGSAMANWNGGDGDRGMFWKGLVRCLFGWLRLRGLAATEGGESTSRGAR